MLLFVRRQQCLVYLDFDAGVGFAELLPQLCREPVGSASVGVVAADAQLWGSCMDFADEGVCDVALRFTRGIVKDSYIGVAYNVV